MESPKERTYIMIKPDGVQRGLIGTIIQRFEQKGFKLVAMKLAQPGKAKFEEHYSDLSKKPFFGGLVESVGKMGKAGGKKTTIAEAQWGNAVLPEQDE